MAALTGNSIASTYKDLLQVSNSNSGIDGTGRTVSDGEGTSSILYLSSSYVGVGAAGESPLHVYKAATSQKHTPEELLRLEQKDEGVDMSAGHGPALTFYVGETGGSDHGGSIAVVREAEGDADSAAAMSFYTAGDDSAPTEKARITSTGKVGIGTTSPTSLLTVAGSISGSSTIENVGAVTFGSTLNVTGAVSGAAGTFTTLGGTSLALQSGGITAAGAIAGATNISGSGTLQMVGNAFLGGTLNVTGNADFDGTVTCDTSLTIDSTTISAAEIGVLDGVSAGTAAASKAVVLDGSKNIATIGTIGCGAITSTGNSSYGTLTGGAISGSGALQIVGNTYLGGTLSVTGNADFDGTVACDTSLTIDSTTISAAEIGVLDGVSAGTAAASKAVVLDGSKNIATLGTVGCGAITSTGNSSYGTLTGGALSSSATLHVVGAVTFGATVASTGSITATGNLSGAAVQGTTATLTSLALQSGGITAAGNIAGAGALSGSGTLEMVGPTRLGSTLGVTGSITSKGDLILDDGGSLKEAGGTAAFTYDGSGHVTKIGQDTPSDGQALIWDTSGTPDRAVWAAVTAGAAGTDTQVQFNDGGSNLGGDGGLTYNKTTDVLSFVNASGSGTLQAVGATTFGSTLNVSGTATLAGKLVIDNEISSSGFLQVVQPTTLGSTLNVSGATTLAGTTSAQALTATTISGSGVLQAVGGTTLGATLNVSGAVTTRANSIGLKMVADGTIAQNDVVTVSGYSGAAFKVKRTHPRDLTSCRGPFYVADAAASDGQELTGVKTKLITGIDTSAYPVGHAVYMDAVDSGSIALTSGSATNHQDLYSFIIPVGRIVSASAAGESLGAYVLDMPAPGRPLVGRVNANTAATNTAVGGFGTEYFHAPVVAMPNQDLGAAPIDDDKQIKTAFIGTGNGGDLRITCDHEMDAEMVFTYIVYI